MPSAQLDIQRVCETDGGKLLPKDVCLRNSYLYDTLANADVWATKLKQTVSLSEPE
jgi:hypothetical protein